MSKRVAQVKRPRFLLIQPIKCDEKEIKNKMSSYVWFKLKEKVHLHCEACEAD